MCSSVNRWSGWSRWRSGKTNLPFHLCPKRRTSSPISAYPSVKCMENTSYSMDLPTGQASYGDRGVRKRLWGSRELWGFFDEVQISRGRSLGGIWRITSCSALHNVTLIACKPWAFGPARGWIPNRSILLYVAAEAERGGWAASWRQRVLLSPALEHPLLGLPIHTKNQAFLLSAWFCYCRWLLFKSLESGNLVL